MPGKTSIKKDTNQTEQVDEFLQHLEHPLKIEIEAVRHIIKNADERISERIKWNAPSFFSHADLVTFNLRPEKYVHLVFHHPSVVNINSEILEGIYKDRRMTYFRNMEEVLARKAELEGIMRELVKNANLNQQ
jgi:uncharacterized protein YdhG (YjbR/CyaY superfamily)